MTAHASLPPSSASRWMSCPGSVALSQGVKRTTNAAAEEGSAAHWLSEQILNAAKINGEFKFSLGEYIYRGANDRFKKSATKPAKGWAWEITEEMYEAVKMYTDYVLDLYRSSKSCQLVVEAKIKIHGEVVFGTVDAVVYEPYRKATIIDLKYGRGVSVDAEDNKQLMCYAVGVLALDEDMDEIEMVIVQPRDSSLKDSIRPWTVSAEALRAWADEHLTPAIIACSQEGAPIRPGSHCRWCPAGAMCPEVAKESLKSAGVEFDGVAIPDMAEPLPLVSLIPDEKLGPLLKAASVVHNWMNALEDYAQARAEAGLAIPGFKLVHKRANRKWVDEVEVVKALEPVLGKEIFDTKLKTPAAMEKTLKENGKKADIKELFHFPDTGLTLVPESDKRQAIQPIVGDFTAIPGLEFLE